MTRDGNKKSDPKRSEESRYGDELLSANWNPIIDLLQWSCARTLSEVVRREEQHLREEDVDAFLGRIYTLGS